VQHVAWVPPLDELGGQQPWAGCPPKLIVFVVASSTGAAAAATAAVAAAQQEQEEPAEQQQGQQTDGGQGDEDAAASEPDDDPSDEPWGPQRRSRRVAQQVSGQQGAAAGTDDMETQPQPPPQQQKGAEGPEQKQHLSLLLLYNAEGLGRVAALNNQQLEARQRQEQQQGRELPLTWIVHLDPHAAHPWPCCDSNRNGNVPCSLDVAGEAGGGSS
jgi:hypothetical protein